MCGGESTRVKQKKGEIIKRKDRKSFFSIVNLTGRVVFAIVRRRLVLALVNLEEAGRHGVVGRGWVNSALKRRRIVARRALGRARVHLLVLGETEKAGLGDRHARLVNHGACILILLGEEAARLGGAAARRAALMVAARQRQQNEGNQKQRHNGPHKGKHLDANVGFDAAVFKLVAAHDVDSRVEGSRGGAKEQGNEGEGSSNGGRKAREAPKEGKEERNNGKENNTEVKAVRDAREVVVRVAIVNKVGGNARRGLERVLGEERVGNVVFRAIDIEAVLDGAVVVWGPSHGVGNVNALGGGGNVCRLKFHKVELV